MRMGASSSCLSAESDRTTSRLSARATITAPHSRLIVPVVLLILFNCQVKADETAPSTRPDVYAELNDGTKVEGVLEQFIDGKYTVRSSGHLRQFSEKDVKHLWFSSRVPRERGKITIDTIERMLRDKDAGVRKQGVAALYNMSVQSGVTLPESLTATLIPLLDDVDDKVSYSVPLILGRIGKPADKIVPVLINTLSDHRYAHLDHHSVLGLGSIGQALRKDDSLRNTITTVLSEAVIKHDDRTVRSYAALQLGYLAPATPATEAALQKATDDTEAHVRQRAREALYKLGITEPSAGLKERRSVELVAVLAGEDSRAAAEARKELSSRTLTEELLEVMMASVRADQHDSYWPSIAYVIAAQKSDAVLKMLVPYGRDKHYRVRRTVVFAYGQMKLTELPPDFARLLDDSHVFVRMTTTDTLAKLSSGAKPDLLKKIVPLLIKGLQDETIHREYWWRAVSALKDIGTAHPDVVPALIAFMKDCKNSSFRNSAAHALRDLARALRNDHDDIDRIATAMGEAMLEEPDASTRRSIVQCLAYMGPRAKGALPALRRATDDPLETVSQPAEAAVRAIAGD